MKLDGKDLTRSQLTIFAIMWIAFLGGIYLFTNILLFESVHFDGVRSLTIVECVYLYSQILTTVGYGDIVPARPRAQVFVGIYVIFTLMIIANVISDVTNVVKKHTEEYYRQLQEVLSTRLMRKLSASGGENDHEGLDRPDSPRSKVKKEFIQDRSPKLPWPQLLKSSLLFLLWCILGVAFFTHYPGEGRSLFEGIYMSVITLSTVGFGVDTPLTEAGKVFGAFWMLFGSGTLIAVVSSFTELMAAMKTRESFIERFGKLDESSHYHSLPERLDLHGFLQFALVYSNLVEECKLDLIDQTFSELGPDEKMQLSKEAVESLLEKIAPAGPSKTASEPEEGELPPSAFAHLSTSLSRFLARDLSGSC